MAATDPSLESLIAKLPPEDQVHMKRLVFGAPVEPMPIPEEAKRMAKEHNFDVAMYRTPCAKERINQPRTVRIGIVQNAIICPTTDPLETQYQAIAEKIEKIVCTAGEMGVNVLCLQESWTTPFFYCTREKRPWLEMAEPVDGPASQLLCPLAKKYDMVIVSPILERDLEHQGTIHNTAVIISNSGQIIGKHRKNHIPRVADFNESTYYFEGDTGHPVFETKYGRVGVNICYGRHHPLNWMGFGLNGAEIVFNPSATVGGLSEPIWPIEGRNAAIANNYFVGCINRVGTELFPNEFTSGDGKKAHHDFGHFYGSSYVANPDGSRTPGLPRDRDGLLVNEVDLNMCQQVKDKWVFQMTARYPMYAELLANYVRHDFVPQVVVDPSLKKSKNL